MTWPTDRNPGSQEARDAGCICAVINNNHGRFAPWPPDGWWVTEGCPVHAFPPSEPWLDGCAVVQHRSLDRSEVAAPPVAPGDAS